MDLGAYLRAIRKSWWIVLAGTALGLGVASFMTLRTPAQYESTVTFFVNTASSNIVGSAQGDAFAQRRVASYAELIKTDKLSKLVADDLRIDMTPAQISATISAKPDVSTVLLTATITDTSPNRALQLAGSVSVQFVNLVTAIEAPDKAAAGAARLEVVDGPTVNPTTIGPNAPRNIAAGLFAGLVLGLLVALLRHSLGTSVRSTRDIEGSLDCEILGVIALERAAGRHPLTIGDRRNSPRAESFRQLRTSLQHLNIGGPVQVVAVTSSVHDEGTSSTATNLAIAFASAGSKVLLIEGDLRTPRLAGLLGLDGSVGLSQVLTDEKELSDALQIWTDARLTLLAAGPVPINPSELLAGQRMVEVITAARKAFDVVVVDTPPLLPVTDAAIVTTWSDGVIVVIRHARTKRTELASATRILASVDARILGSVPNMVPTAEIDAYGYGSGVVRSGPGSESLVTPFPAILGQHDTGEPQGHLANGHPKQPLHTTP